MKLYLMRHGACEPLKDGMDDNSRKLTPEGAESIKNSMPGLKALVGQIEYIFTSPKTRAIQTATIAAEYFKCTNFIESTDALAGPGGEPSISKSLNRIIGKDHVLIVGHVPALEQLGAYFTGNDPEQSFSLSKGGIAKIYIKGFPGPGEGRLEWIRTSAEIASAADHPNI